MPSSCEEDLDHYFAMETVTIVTRLRHLLLYTFRFVMILCSLSVDSLLPSLLADPVVTPLETSLLLRAAVAREPFLHGAVATESSITVFLNNPNIAVLP